MGEACRKFDTPVTGGNVSFYNENPSGAVFPTPTIGMLGVIENVAKHTTTAGFKKAGNHVYLLSPSTWAFKDDLGGSEYLTMISDGTPTGDCPHLDLDEEVAVHEALLELIQKGVVASAHDISDGGIAVCLAECAIFSAGLGCQVDLATESRLDATLFGESQSRIVFTSPRALTTADLSGTGAVIHHIGTVTPETVQIAVNGDVVIESTREALTTVYNTAIEDQLAD